MNRWFICIHVHEDWDFRACMLESLKRMIWYAKLEISHGFEALNVLYDYMKHVGS